MTYALIKMGIILNVIMATPQTISLEAPMYDQVVQISTGPGSPGINWTCVKCDGTDFVAPATN